MNWLNRARREIGGRVEHPTANAAERNPMTVLAVCHSGCPDATESSIGGNGSVPSWEMLESEALREAFEERAAIMEFDGGLSRDDAERAAWAIVARHHRPH